MSKKTKLWLVIAVFLVLVGCIIFGGVMTMLKWDFSKLSTVKYETNKYSINENFKNISINTDTSDILFVESESSETLVTCYEEKNARHLVSVKENTLEIKLVDTKKWYEHIGISFDTPKITVYIPQGEYRALLIQSSTGDTEIPEAFMFESIYITASTGDVKSYSSASKNIKILTNTGDIDVNNITANKLSLSVSTGKITMNNAICEDEIEINVSTGKSKLTNIKCKNITSSGNTGNISLSKVLATEKLDIKRSTGDVMLNACDAAEIRIKTDTGSVTGNLQTEKIFIVQSDTGNINVPKTVSGGKCEINTDTGDIKINIID